MTNESAPSAAVPSAKPVLRTNDLLGWGGSSAAQVGVNGIRACHADVSVFDTVSPGPSEVVTK